MNPSRREFRKPLETALIVISVTVLVTGCTMPRTLPSFASAKSETKAALAEVLAVLPITSPVEQLGEDSFGCGSLGMAEEGAGVSFTDHVAVVQADDFDMRGFVRRLPELLGPSFEVSETDVPVDFALVDVRAIEHGGAQLSVSARESDGERFVEIYASSRCAEPPSNEQDERRRTSREAGR